jgi:heme/copper-type cytochrome/quinol oxidase subunit 2
MDNNHESAENDKLCPENDKLCPENDNYSRLITGLAICIITIIILWLVAVIVFFCLAFFRPSPSRQPNPYLTVFMALVLPPIIITLCCGICKCFGGCGLV